MKAENLMIGNWIYLIRESNKNNGKLEVTKVTPQRVTGIMTDTDHPCIQTDATDTYYGEESYKPIPLTDEILEKNGFEYNKEETEGDIQSAYKHYTRFFNFPLGRGFYIEHDTVDGIFWISDHCWIKFKYVHEFQQILGLCKLNKKIEI